MAGPMTNYSTDDRSRCCGKPEDCDFRHLYCINRTPKEADVSAMNEFEKKTFEAAFRAAETAVQTTINHATHGSTPAKDEIKRPDHYARFAIEPCTFIMLNELPYWCGNVVKYVTRAPHKHADERIDIRKAIRYCEMRIEELDRVAAGTDGDVIGRPL